MSPRAALPLVLAPLATPAQEMTFELAPEADAFIQSGLHSQTHFGLDPLIALKSSGACDDSVRKGLMVFDVSPFEGVGFTSAVLSVELLPGSATSSLLWGIVDDADWDPDALPESEIDWENAPKNAGVCLGFAFPGTTLLSLWTTGPGVHDFDVTAYVRWALGQDPSFALQPKDADGRITFLLYNAIGFPFDPADMHSKESATGSGPVLRLKAPFTSTGCEQAQLAAGDPTVGDRLGEAVSFSGSRAVAGASGDDDAGTASGSVGVFERAGTGWVQTAKLTAGDAAAGALFGRAVAIDGGTIAVGAHSDDGTAVDAGAVYVFELTGSTWTEVAKLSAPDPTTSQHLGNSAALQGDFLLVGAYRDSEGGPGAGAAYLYERRSGSWGFAAKLLAADPQPGALFGASVTLDGGTLAIGAPEEDRAGSFATGAVYVFEDGPAGWQHAAELWPADFGAGDEFGKSLDLLGDTLLAGAWLDDGACEGTPACDAGAAYVFERSGSIWIESARLLPSEPEAGLGFGSTVALTADLAVVGAPWDDHDEHGTQGVGSVELFARDGTGWSPARKLFAADVEHVRRLGFSLATSGGLVLAGAPETDPGLAQDAGSIHLFGLYLCGDAPHLSVTTGGKQTLSLFGGPAVAGDAYLVAGSSSGVVPGFSFQGFDVPLNVDAYLLLTLAHPLSSFLPGSLGILDAQGKGLSPFVLPTGAAPALVGMELFHAYAAFDAGSLQIHQVSNPVGLELVP